MGWEQGGGGAERGGAVEGEGVVSYAIIACSMLFGGIIGIAFAVPFAVLVAVLIQRRLFSCGGRK